MTKTVLILLGIVLTALLVFGIVYKITGLGKWLYHNILEWHMPVNEKNFDGYMNHSVCKYCGKRIVQDSQGNWW